MTDKKELKEKEAAARDEKQRITFEQALEELEAIVHDLEEGRLGLDASLEKYEQGVRRLRQCYDMLDHAERKIELLTQVDEHGRPQLKPFDDTATLDDTSAEAKQPASSKTRKKRKKKRAKATDDEIPPSGENFLDDTPHLF